jgi:hypothetical protein
LLEVPDAPHPELARRVVVAVSSRQRPRRRRRRRRVLWWEPNRRRRIDMEILFRPLRDGLLCSGTANSPRRRHDDPVSSTSSSSATTAYRIGVQIVAGGSHGGVEGNQGRSHRHGQAKQDPPHRQGRRCRRRHTCSSFDVVVGSRAQRRWRRRRPTRRCLFHRCH